ncbi:MAG: archaemetzincin family Zn-dependent metalloprotease [Nitrososphaeraceae archaeon]
MSRYHTRIIIVPVIVDYSKQHGDNGGTRGDQTAAAVLSESYLKLVKQLLNSFSRIVITVDVHDLLILDQSSSTNLDLFDKTRNQWKSSMILEWILRETNPNSYTTILAICDFDAYSNGFNFVFGEAQMGGRVGAIYLSRLRQEFHGHISDSDLFQQRITKEVVHELGHLFRLSHCERRNCVMHFSNSLKDTDFKGYDFCDRCTVLLFNMHQ